MAVVTVAARPVHEAEVTDTPNGREYSVNYWVETNSFLDGPQVVIDATGLPDFGDTYALGNDSDDSAFLLEKSASILQGDGGNQTKWNVRCRYGLLEVGGDGGAPTNSPTDEAPQIEVGVHQVQEAVRLATYLGKYPVYADPANQLLGSEDLGPRLNPFTRRGTLNVPHNSAGESFEPALERSIGYPAFRITRNEASIAGRLPWLNKTNIDDFILILGGENLRIRPQELYMNSITGTYRRAIIRSSQTSVGQQVVATRVNRLVLSYWRISYEMLYKDNPAIGSRRGWLTQILDRGMNRAVEPGDPDSGGGTYSAADLSPAREPVPQIEAIRDGRGNRVARDVLLNGYGKVLSRNQQPVTLIWSIHDSIPFAPLGL